MQVDDPAGVADTLIVERYRYLLRQIEAVNESSHRFLRIYQTLATTLVGAALALYTGWAEWDIDPNAARMGIIGLLILVTMVALFTAGMVVIGILTWIDYRREECDLLDQHVAPGFRSRPDVRNMPRWYELYVVAFIVVSVVALWLLASMLVLPTVS
ncbi:hypothetical protein [Promicromonospora sukumoe]|uniref:hypothetical protein n=1 Tax=Promicromonospora sukumoe TaxID=88382 RepID=UPI003668A244